jgi:hypothetical protein
VKTDVLLTLTGLVVLAGVQESRGKVLVLVNLQ